MPTIEEIKNKYKHITFIYNKEINTVTVFYKNKFVRFLFTDYLETLNIGKFKRLMLDPIVYAIEAKVKQENKNA